MTANGSKTFKSQKPETTTSRREKMRLCFIELDAKSIDDMQKCGGRVKACRTGARQEMTHRVTIDQICPPISN